MTERISHNQEDRESKAKKLEGLFQCEAPVCDLYVVSSNSRLFVCREKMEEGEVGQGTLVF